ncbi:MAG: pyruvate, water dikinase, partial [Deltaproteobacteria bacterium]|nr:pyruvate, water dikinase [Deltaproteobacteria bacterium]
MNPTILRLEDIRDEAVGGKAAGLARLHAIGLRVPAGFAILGATSDHLPSDLLSRYRELGGGKVAVRSSALDEDAGDASFAGQYDTLLDIEGEDALCAAVRQCLDSLSGERADLYREERATGEVEGGAMCVVVQRMVDSRAAGVLFSADPVTHRRAHTVIDAVPGLGEALVSGLETPDHYLLDRSGAVLHSDLVGEHPILTPSQLQQLLAEAREAEADRGVPLDLEWAIDAEGQLWWLQARPITTLGPDLNELDTWPIDPRHVYTRCNIGEMFPGVCTPLSYSFTVWAIDVGMQRMHMRIGVQDEFLPQFKFVAMSHGQLFLNLTTLSDASTQTFGGDARDLTLSICGRIITEPKIHVKPPPGWPRRFSNIARYFRYLFGQRKARRSLKALVADLHFAPSDESAAAMWHAIDEKFDAIFDAMDWHLVSSATAGVMAPTLLGIFSKGEEPSEAHHSEVAALLAGAEDVESADIAAGANRIQNAALAHPDVAERFVDVSVEDALAWLSGEESGKAGREYRRYLARHGHRAIKELELRQAEWRENPLPLIASLKVCVGSRLQDAAEDRSPGLPQPKSKSRDHGLGLRLLTRLAHQTVRSREETKSGLVA